MSDTPRLEEIESAFHRALELDDTDRTAYLDELRSRRPALAREVDTLLQVDQEADDFFRIDGRPDEELRPGTVLGGFEILGPIARGGMGAVYRAQQSEPRRTVALKVLSHALTASARNRFQLESEILAHLKHPGIAQVHDAGVQSGVAWFAMELLEDRSLVEHARGLSLRETLELFADVCDAVQHAHQRGVIHRDLKPSNILMDESGRPKLVDFGIARVEAEALSEGDRTSPGTILGTLAYMSPEQASGRTSEIDARSDIYSLGVILHELVAGQLPYPLPQEVPAALRAIVEREPTGVRHVDRSLGSDLDVIVRTALHKEARRRYASADALGADIRHLLADEPIRARPVSMAYHLAKYARRHRVTVTLAVVAVLAVAGGVIASLVSAGRALRAAETAERREREANESRRWAQLESEKAGELSGVLAELLTSAQPGVGAGRNVKILDVLDSWSDYLARADIEPETRVVTSTLLGKTCERLGFYGQALDLLERAESVGREALPPSSAALAWARIRLAEVYHVHGRLDDALEQVRTARSATADDPARRLTRLLLEARVLHALDRLVEAERTARACTTLADGVDLPDAVSAEIASTLGEALDAQGRNGEAAAIIEPALEKLTPRLGPRHPAIITLRCQHLGVLLTEGRALDAEAAAASALQDASEVLGHDHRQTLQIMQYAGRILLERGRLDEALASTRDLLATCEEIWEQPTPTSIRTRIRLGVIQFRRAAFADALDVLERARSEARDVFGPGARLSCKASEYACRTLVARGEPERGVALATEALAGSRGPLTAERVGLERARAAAMLRLGRLEEAERALRDLQRRVDAVPGFNRLERGRLLNDLAAALYRQERFAEAEPIVRRLVDLRRAWLGDRHASTLRALSNLGTLLYRIGRLKDAEPLLRESVAGLAGTDVTASAIGYRLVWGVCLRDLGRLDEAERELRRAHRDATSTLPADHQLVRRTQLSLQRLEERRRNER